MLDPSWTWSDRHGMASPPRPSYSGSFLWQSPVFAMPSFVAPSVYLVQTHGTPVVQSTDPAGSFFAGAPPIFANSSSFEPGHAIVPFGVQNSMSVFGPQ